VSASEPDPLRVVGATELERKLLAAAGSELPDPELRARMARAIGLAGVATGTALAAAGSGSATTGSTLSWPVLSASIAALALTGAAIGYTSHRAQREAPIAARPAPAAPAPAEVAPAVPSAPSAAAPELAPAPAPAPHRRRRVAPAPAADLRAEIALLDAVRGAVAEGADQRALALLRRYEAHFPDGTFRPESTALRIEVLAHLGQTQQAQTLGAEFLASHPDSPLAARVRRALGR
jgi:hypothetical protein